MPDIEDAVRQLGLVIAKTTERELVCACPAHEERTGHRDTNPSLWVNREHGQFICRSCQFKGPFEALVRYMGGTSEDAERFLGATSALQRLLNPQTTPAKPPEPAPVVYPETLLDRFTEPPPDALDDRLLTAQAAADYGILWHAGRRMWILPIRNADGELLGFQAKGVSSYFMFPKGLKKGDALFGWHTVTDTVIVVESPLDAARIAAAGIPGAVATYGTSVTREQLAHIFSGRYRVILALDNDTSGRLVTRQILKNFGGRGETVLLYDYGTSHAKDPGEQSDAEVRYGYRNAASYLQRLLWRRNL